jgi:hypothetical protein
VEAGEKEGWQVIFRIFRILMLTKRLLGIFSSLSVLRCAIQCHAEMAQFLSRLLFTSEYPETSLGDVPALSVA